MTIDDHVSSDYIIEFCFGTRQKAFLAHKKNATLVARQKKSILGTSKITKLGFALAVMAHVCQLLGYGWVAFFTYFRALVADQTKAKLWHARNPQIKFYFGSFGSSMVLKYGTYFGTSVAEQ